VHVEVPVGSRPSARGGVQLTAVPVELRETFVRGTPPVFVTSTEVVIEPAAVIEPVKASNVAVIEGLGVR